MVRIWGKYRSLPPEVIDTADSQKDAEYLVQEYRLAYGADWIIWCGKRNNS